ncbi:MAG: TrmH family RNA methyltransferase, partial [Candidatus Margulisiibacteriota bacterium]
DKVKLFQVPTLQELQDKNPDASFYYLSSKVKTPYFSMKFKPGDFLVFGKETKGLPAELLKDNPDTAITIPMSGEVRSINLSTSVGIVLYEAIRQNYEFK